MNKSITVDLSQRTPRKTVISPLKSHLRKVRSEARDGKNRFGDELLSPEQIEFRKRTEKIWGDVDNLDKVMDAIIRHNLLFPMIRNTFMGMGFPEYADEDLEDCQQELTVNYWSYRVSDPGCDHVTALKKCKGDSRNWVRSNFLKGVIKDTRDTMETVEIGEIPFSSALPDIIPLCLTRRQRKVVRLLARGYNAREIAGKLNLSESLIYKATRKVKARARKELRKLPPTRGKTTVSIDDSYQYFLCRHESLSYDQWQ